MKLFKLIFNLEKFGKSEIKFFDKFMKKNKKKYKCIYKNRMIDLEQLSKIKFQKIKKLIVIPFCDIFDFSYMFTESILLSEFSIIQRKKK